MVLTSKYGEKRIREVENGPITKWTQRVSKKYVGEKMTKYQQKKSNLGSHWWPNFLTISCMIIMVETNTETKRKTGRQTPKIVPRASFSNWILKLCYWHFLSHPPPPPPPPPPPLLFWISYYLLSLLHVFLRVNELDIYRLMRDNEYE